MSDRLNRELGYEVQQATQKIVKEMEKKGLTNDKLTNDVLLPITSLIPRLLAEPASTRN